METSFNKKTMAVKGAEGGLIATGAVIAAGALRDQIPALQVIPIELLTAGISAAAFAIRNWFKNSFLPARKSKKSRLP